MTDDLKIKEISERIWNNPNGRKVGFLVPFSLELQKLPIWKFIAFNFITFSDTYVFSLMIELRAYYKNLKIKDWLLILDELGDNEKALSSFITFCIKYLGLDIRLMLPRTRNYNPRIYTKINIKIETLEGFTTFGVVEKFMLKYHGVTESDFDAVRSNLMKQGVQLFSKKTALKSNVKLIYNKGTGNYEEE